MNRAWKSYSKTHVKNIKYDSWISCNKQTNKWNNCNKQTNKCNNCNKQTNKSCNREKGCSKMFSGWEVFVPECDICKNFDTNEYLNIFVSTNLHKWISEYIRKTNLTRTNVRISIRIEDCIRIFKQFLHSKYLWQIYSNIWIYSSHSDLYIIQTLALMWSSNKYVFSWGEKHCPVPTPQS